jgi:hypothetical protein
MKKAKPQTKRKALAGKVGIFWVFEGKLLAAPFVLADGVEYGDAINGATDHVHYWPKFHGAHPALRYLEYQEVPRGRVLFMKPTQEYHVYMDKTLFKPRIKQAITAEFDLQTSTTTFLLDPHYTTDAEELSRLFAYE